MTIGLVDFISAKSILQLYHASRLQRHKLSDACSDHRETGESGRGGVGVLLKLLALILCETCLGAVVVWICYDVPIA